MMNYLQRLIRERNNDQGFSLIEVMVAMLVGAIVMGIAIAVIGSTNSTAIRVLAKSDAQINTRDSLVKVFENLADADSLENCRIADRLWTQNKITTKPLGHPDIQASECKESASTGYVLAWAQPNIVCYFKTEHHTGGNVSDDPPDVMCIARGGAGARSTYTYTPPSTPTIPPSTSAYPTSTAIAHLGMTLGQCVSNPLPGRDERLVFAYTCQAQGGNDVNSIDWPTTFSAPSSIFVIADLGASLDVSVHPLSNLFRYTMDGTASASATGSVTNAELDKVVAIDVRMTVTYQTGRLDEGGLDRYLFRQKIVLRKSKLALGENFNG